MRKMILFFSIFALAACSSNSKNEEMPASDTSTEAAAPAPQQESTPAETTDSMTADTGANMDGGFPDVEGTERSGATCKNGSDERMVSVVDTREGPCGVTYTKHGDKKTVAYAKFEMSFCDKVYDNILSNLTAGGFDCGGAAATASPTEEAPAEETKTEEATAE